MELAVFCTFILKQIFNIAKIEAGTNDIVQSKVAEFAKALETSVAFLMEIDEADEEGDFFSLQIQGDSMEPRIYDGDMVIVHRQEDADSGDTVVVMVDGNNAVCRRLAKYSGGIGLISLNSKYQPVMFSDKDIVERSVRIVGKVVELMARL